MVQEQKIDKNNTLILVVDDNSQNLNVISSLLKIEEYKFALANSGQKAIEIADRTVPDIILLDIMMPGMDGYEVCKILKENEKTKNIPIIFLTAKSETEDIVKGFELGGVDYVVKPFRQAELLQRIDTHLKLKFAQERIEKQKDALIELNNQKDKFFSIIAHDLKNPYTGLIGYIQVLIEDFDSISDSVKLKYLGNTLKMLRGSYELLENLLYWSRLKTGRIEPQVSVLNLYSLINQIHPVITLMLDNKKLRFSNTVDQNLNFRGDYFMISTVLRNLLNNAIKFTPQTGEIIFSAEKNEDMLKISVKDTGIGMDEQLVKDLFRIDKKVQREGTENEQGTGLGLLLCKEFVEANGGKIWAESKEGAGSEFIFTLPIAEEDDESWDSVSGSDRKYAELYEQLKKDKRSVPGRGTLESLYKAAMTGDVRLIQDFAEDLSSPELGYREFGLVLHKMINEFAVDKIVAFLKPYVDDTKSDNSR